MIEDTEPTKLANAAVGVTNAITGEEDIMIVVEGFYSDHPEEGH